LLFVGLLVGSLWLEIPGVALIAYSLFRRFIKPQMDAAKQTVRQAPQMAAQLAPLAMMAL